MNGMDLLTSMNGFSELLVDSAAGRPKRRGEWAKIVAAAACLAIVVGGLAAYRESIPVATTSPAEAVPHAVQRWREGMPANRYFQYSGSGGSSSSSSLAAVPWAESRSFTDERGTMESEGVIPALDDHPLFDAEGHYRADSSLYSIVLSWHIRPQGGQELKDAYSDLTVTAGYEEVPQISDAVSVELDEDGRVIEPSVTVTERDGVYIVGTRNGNGKTLTWQTDEGWYQIAGSWNDGYEDMAILLDWFWAHPLDFGRFAMGNGDLYTWGELADFPEIRKYIPDFAALGYTLSDGTTGNGERVRTKNGAFDRLEFHYDTGASSGLSWSIKTDPDYYERQETLGELRELTYEKVSEFMQNERHIAFTWDGYYIRCYVNSDVGPNAVWRIIQSIQ